MSIAVALPHLVPGWQQVDVKFHAVDVCLGLAGDMQFVAIKIQLGQLSLEFGGVHAKVDHRTEKHVAADAAKNIEIKRAHPFTAICRARELNDF